MANWDIFHTDRLEAERSLSTEAVREAVVSGAIKADDLVRPAGSSGSWARIGDTPQLLPSYGAEEPASTRDEVPKTPARPAPPPPVDGTDGPAPAVSQSRPTPGSPPPDSASRASRPDDREPILDADLVEEGEVEAVEPEKVREELEPLPFDADDSAFDFDDSIPAPPLAKTEETEEERTVELPPRSSKPTRPATALPGPPTAPIPAALEGPSNAVSERDAEHEAEGDAGAAFDSGAIPTPGLADRRAAPIVETSSETLTSAELFGLFDPLDEDEEAAAFTLAAEPRDEPEEIDLTAMVDVAFQLVLFFLVTATTLYFKTLEIPTPDPEDPDAVAQQMRTLDELLDEYILVEIDPQGRISIDREPIDLANLTDRLRQARADTLRTGMLLMADFTTPHRNAVSAIDSANALGLQIAIARPSPPQ